MTIQEFIKMQSIAKAAIGLAVELGIMPKTQPCPNKCGIAEYNSKWADGGVYECPVCHASIDAMLVAERIVKGGRGKNKLELVKTLAFMTGGK